GRASACAAHVAHWDELEPLVDRIYGELGRIDVLVNNAGSSPLYEKLTAVSEELWDKTLAVNLKGPFRLCALAGERMAAAGGGAPERRTRSSARRSISPATRRASRRAPC